MKFQKRDFKNSFGLSVIGSHYSHENPLEDDVREWLKQHSTGFYRCHVGYFVNLEQTREIWGVKVFLFKNLDAINFKMRWSDYIVKEDFGE